MPASSHNKTWGAEEWLYVGQTGTAFPTSPADGQSFYRTDHHASYHYDPTAARWLGDAVHEVEGGDTAAMAVSIYYREYTLGAGGTRYSATYGRQFGFDVVCVGMTIFSAITPAVSARAVVTDDGTAVTGASITLTTPATSGQSEALLSSVIVAGSVIGLQNDALGATLGATKVIARFRRAEA